MKDLDKIIFGDVKFSKILEEIYQNQKKKETQISGLISELKELIGDIGDATLVVPLIKEYLEIGVKNDEQLVKLATIVQRITQISSTSTGDNPFTISEAEKKQLLDNIDKLKKNE